jgi:hypothetical protein
VSVLSGNIWPEPGGRRAAIPMPRLRGFRSVSVMRGVAACVNTTASSEGKEGRSLRVYSWLTGTTGVEWQFLEWNDLVSLGCVYQLGHGGHPCPHPAPAVRTMVVVDTQSIQSVKYRYCTCDKSDDAMNLEQLLRNGWYPATTMDPATCATFASLELYRLLNVVGNINVHDFVGTLERRSDACQVKAVPVGA